MGYPLAVGAATSALIIVGLLQGVSAGRPVSYPGITIFVKESLVCTLDDAGSDTKATDLNTVNVQEKPQRRNAMGSPAPNCQYACQDCVPCSLVVINALCGNNDAEPCPSRYMCQCGVNLYPLP